MWETADYYSRITEYQDLWDRYSVVGWVFFDILKEWGVFIFSASPWRWRHYDPSKCHEILTWQQSVTSQKAWFLMPRIIYQQIRSTVEWNKLASWTRMKFQYLEALLCYRYSVVCDSATTHFADEWRVLQHTSCCDKCVNKYLTTVCSRHVRNELAACLTRHFQHHWASVK
jgi:hypothetical protein